METRVVLITGAASGIGLATALVFAGRDSRVAFIDMGQLPAEVQAQYITTDPPRGMYFSADVRQFLRMEQIVAEVLQQWGRVDVLINCAGISRDRVLWKMTDEDWDQVLEVNLKGCFNTIRACTKPMREQKRGKIVNVSSINALRGRLGIANYAASKAGLIALTRSAARELGSFGICVNAVAPGYIDTPLMAKYPPEMRQRAIQESALGKVGTPADVAEAIWFLASPQADHITGQVLVVDGGQSM